MSPTREFTACLLAAVLGSGLVVMASGQAWFTVGETEVSGQEVVPLAGAAGLAGLAAVAALVATRGVARRFVGLVIVACGAAVLVESMAPREFGTVTRPAGTIETAMPVMTSWPWFSAGGAVVLLAAGAFAAVRAGRWPAMSARYDRTRIPAGSGGASRTDVDLWDAIDRGIDPTEETPAATPEETTREVTKEKEG